MIDSTDDFIKMFISLNTTERRQVFQIIKTIESGDPSEKRMIFESLGLNLEPSIPLSELSKYLIDV